MKKVLLLLFFIVLVLMPGSFSFAQYKIERIVSGIAGGTAAGNFQVTGTAGQVVTGKTESSLFRSHTGFWYTVSYLTGVNDIDIPPDVYMLYQNYPNPFNPSTKIRYQLPEETTISLKVYNILGEEAAVLVNAVQPAGSYTYEWNASGLSSGFYIYRLEAGKYVSVKKLVLLK